MKVVSQLAQHFWRSDKLTANEASYLVTHGFVRAKDLPGYKEPSNDVAQGRSGGLTGVLEDIGPSDNLDVIQEHFSQKSLRERKSFKYCGCDASCGELLRRIGSELIQRASYQENLVAIATEIDSSINSTRSAHLVRRTPQREFNAALTNTIRTGTVSLQRLWRLLDLDDFQELARLPELRGPAAQSLKVLLAVRHPVALGRYGWLLAFDEIRELIAIRTAYQKLMLALHHLYHHEFRLLSGILSKGCDPSQFWGMVLVHNACGQNAFERNGKFRKEYVLPPRRVDVRDWRRACLSALEIDAPSVNRFMERGGFRSNCPPFQLSHDGFDFYCPIGWHNPSKF